MDLSLSELRLRNLDRQRAVFPREGEWGPADWAIAFAGEAGEVCNAVKKLRRIDEGTNTPKDPQTTDDAINQIAGELADTIIYADLLAAKLGIHLPNAIINKFNVVSERYGCDIKLQGQ